MQMNDKIADSLVEQEEPQCLLLATSKNTPQAVSGVFLSKPCKNNSAALVWEEAPGGKL